MYNNNDLKRRAEEVLRKNEVRSPFRIDYCRVLHAPAFRRLQGKTQLFPSSESDFFRNRLTHSLEVAQISKAIGIYINRTHLEPESHIDLDILEVAGLAHDIGHPPFGHQGEEALDFVMRDSGGFEGNAQTLRILTRLEKKIFKEVVPQGDDNRVGLNLTYRALASVLKYDKVIPHRTSERLESQKTSLEKEITPCKGFYLTDQDIVNAIKVNVLGDKPMPDGISFKTIECQIMDIADDIAYSTYDLEDSLKGGFTNIFDMLFSNKAVLTKVAETVNPKFFGKKQIDITDIKDVLFSIFKMCFLNRSEIEGEEEINETDKFLFDVGIAYSTSKIIANNGYYRQNTTSSLINEFINGVVFEYNKDYPAFSSVKLNNSVRRKVEVLKKVNFYNQILSPKLVVSAYRGKKIVSEIFSILSDSQHGYLMMPEDHIALYESFSHNKDYQKRIICDFIASMTDRYCVDYYGRLTSQRPDSIFIPF